MKMRIRTKFFYWNDMSSPTCNVEKVAEWYLKCRTVFKSEDALYILGDKGVLQIPYKEKI